MKTAKDILIDARKLLAHGWIQGDSEAHGCFCMMGALNKATTGSSHHQPIPYQNEALYREYVAAHTAVSDATPYGSMVSFNDDEGRTQVEVLAVMDQAIEKVSR